MGHKPRRNVKKKKKMLVKMQHGQNSEKESRIKKQEQHRIEGSPTRKREKKWLEDKSESESRKWREIKTMKNGSDRKKGLADNE